MKDKRGRGGGDRPRRGGTPVKRRPRDRDQRSGERGDRDRPRDRDQRFGERGDRDRPRREPRGRPARPGRDRPERTERERPSRGPDAGRVWRPPASARPSLDAVDRALLAAASAAIGPGGYRRFADIPAHQRGRKLRVEFYQLAKGLPADEADNLVGRIKSEATTTTAALVKGFGEGTFRTAIQGALQSRGALYALQDHLDQLEQLGLIASDQRQALGGELDEVIAAVNEYLGELVRDRDRLAVSD